MTQVAILDRKAKHLTAFDSQSASLDDAFAAANLKRGAVDFGSISTDYGIIVYEFGLLEGSPDAYFRLGKQLFNGNAILFKTDSEGETIDFPLHIIDHMNNCNEVEFFDNLAAVEAAIKDGRIVWGRGRFSRWKPGGDLFNELDG